MTSAMQAERERMAKIDKAIDLIHANGIQATVNMSNDFLVGILDAIDWVENPNGYLMKVWRTVQDAFSDREIVQALNDPETFAIMFNDYGYAQDFVLNDSTATSMILEYGMRAVVVRPDDEYSQEALDCEFGIYCDNMGRDPKDPKEFWPIRMTMPLFV